MVGFSSIIKLKNKEVLLSSSYGGKDGQLNFWNLNDYTSQHTIKGYGVDYHTHMVGLSDGNIALSFSERPHPIVIIDSSSYKVKKKIYLKGLVTSSSNLCVFDQYSFIYAHDDLFLQISNEDGAILFQSEEGTFDGVYRKNILLDGGNYIAVKNVNGQRLTIIKPSYD